MIKYYCDICGNEGNDSEYSLPLHEIIIYYSPGEEEKCIVSREELHPVKTHLCKHCALRIGNFIKNEMIPRNKTYNEVLRSMTYGKRQ